MTCQLKFQRIKGHIITLYRKIILNTIEYNTITATVCSQIVLQTRLLLLHGALIEYTYDVLLKYFCNISKGLGVGHVAICSKLHSWFSVFKPLNII